MRRVIRELNGEVEVASAGGELWVVTVTISEAGDQDGKDPAGENLPGKWDGGIDGDRPVGLTEIEMENFIGECLDNRKTATAIEIGDELLQERFPQAKTPPRAVAAVDGLMGGEVARQVVPGDVVADFVDDGFEDEAIVDERPRK